MYATLLIVHILAAVLLVVVILIQRGRGGGLVESFSGVESMFGTKTSLFLTRATTVLAVTFLVTSISLALLAARQSRSLISEEAISSVEEDLADEGQTTGPELPQAPEGQEQAVQEQAVQDKTIAE